MIKLSPGMIPGLVLIAVVLATPSITHTQNAKKPTLLKGARPLSEEPAQRMYFTSASQNENKIMSVRQVLFKAGARNINVFLPGLIVCDVPLGVNARVLVTDPDITVSDEDRIDHSDAAAPVFSREWAKRWYLEADKMAGLQHRRTVPDPALAAPAAPETAAGSYLRQVPEEVVWRNARSVEAKGAGAADERLIFQNCEIMSGNILLQLVLPESDGPSENWTDAEIASAAGAVLLSTFYFQREGRRTDVNFVTRRVERARTSTEPISWEATRDSMWVSDVMMNLGYPDYASKYLESVHAFNNFWRERYHADWVFTAFAVRSVNAPDHRFLDSRNVNIVYQGGPFMAIPYPAGEPGSFQFSQAFTLGISHIFWSFEEAFGSPEECTATAGYLNYENKNKTTRMDRVTGIPMTCVQGVIHQPCIADKTDVLDNGYVGPPCEFTQGIMGIMDENPRDGVPDAFGIGPDINFGTTAAETLTSQLASVKFDVISRAVPNRNALQPPALRRDYAAPVRDASYTVCGVGPIALRPLDGEFDELEETFDVDVPILLPGYSDLVVTARNAYGASSEALKRVFYLGLDYFGFRFVHRNGGVGLGWNMRGETFGADFELHRIDHKAGDVDTVVATGLRPIGSTSEGGLTPYYYFDTTVSPGLRYGYFIRGSFEVLYRGEMTTFSTDSDTFQTIASFRREEGILSLPSPNPFNPSVDGRTWVSVSVPDAPGIASAQPSPAGSQLAASGEEPSPVEVTIRVYDVMGRLVKHLFHERVFTTVINQFWDGTNRAGNPVPSGMYFIKAKAGTTTGTKKVLVIR